MRKSRVEAANTRARIVQTAAATFRERGVNATGLADLMKNAGLTHGGFYKHFESKDQVVAEAAAAAVNELADAMTAELAEKSPGRGLAMVVSHYLSHEHRDTASRGCPIAAMGDELARAGPAVRHAMTAGVERIIALLAGQFATLPTAEAKRRAQATFAMMLGAIVLSRIVDDSALSDEILTASKRAVMTPT